MKHYFKAKSIAPTVVKSDYREGQVVLPASNEFVDGLFVAEDEESFRTIKHLIESGQVHGLTEVDSEYPEAVVEVADLVDVLAPGQKPLPIPENMRGSADKPLAPGQKQLPIPENMRVPAQAEESELAPENREPILDEYEY